MYIKHYQRNTYFMKSIIKIAYNKNKLKCNYLNCKSVLPGQYIVYMCSRVRICYTLLWLLNVSYKDRMINNEQLPLVSPPLGAEHLATEYIMYIYLPGYGLM